MSGHKINERFPSAADFIGHIDDDQELMKCDIDYRTANTFVRQGKVTVGDVRGMTISEMLAIPGVGRKTVARMVMMVLGFDVGSRQ